MGSLNIDWIKILEFFILPMVILFGNDIIVSNSAVLSPLSFWLWLLTISVFAG